MRADPISPAAIAEAAFVSAYPLLERRRLMVQATATAAPDPETLRAPVNTLVHGRATPDTLRCSAWLDLGGGPIVLSVPDTWGRYYALWLRDAWGRVFASIGARTTGTGRRDFILLGPGSRAADAPRGPLLVAPTRTVQIAGRIEAVGETDAWAYTGFRLSGARAPAPAAVPGEADLNAAELLATVLRVAEDEHARNAPLDRLRELGVASVTAEGLELAVRRGRAVLRVAAQSCSAHGWQRVCDEPAADVLHLLAGTDAEQRPLSGAERYLLRFEPDNPPPAHGFWELIAGGRSIGDRHPLALDVGGALEFHIQHKPPARAQRWNWLPAPAGPFSLGLHLYWPRAEPWSPPPITRLR
jgi:hypothetical protein